MSSRMKDGFPSVEARQIHKKYKAEATAILSLENFLYASQAEKLGVSPNDLYTALLADAENLPPNWDLMGRQTDAWKQFNYLPADVVEPGGTPTKEVSRALEYAFGDFIISQVARILNKTDDVQEYVARAGNFINHWDSNTTMPDNSGPASVKGMMQKRLINQTFVFTDPRHCSVHDPLHSGCNTVANFMDGFYEGSPLLYSQYVPHDNAKLIELQGGNESFLERLDFIIDNGYFDSSNEPGQQIPFMYHYVNRPGLSTQRSRQTIAQFFGLNTTGIPGNDDSGAMVPPLITLFPFYLLLQSGFQLNDHDQSCEFPGKSIEWDRRRGFCQKRLDQREALEVRLLSGMGRFRDRFSRRA
ncbi:glycosyl hydrolase family 92-domain-containing protein [Amylostereum chailletii]|nr:glycosyl hydrolase family 92-domain-containing protein [Amylostereum chailletii]